MAINGKVFHVEVKSEDSAATSDFFNTAFNWPMMSPGPGFFMFDTPGNFEGHIGPIGEDKSAGTVAYIEVDSADAALKSVESSGGKSMSPINEVPGQGRFFYFREPGGSTWVAWEPEAGTESG